MICILVTIPQTFAGATKLIKCNYNNLFLFVFNSQCRKWITTECAPGSKRYSKIRCFILSCSHIYMVKGWTSIDLWFTAYSWSIHRKYCFESCHPIRWRQLLLHCDIWHSTTTSQLSCLCCWWVNSEMLSLCIYLTLSALKNIAGLQIATNTVANATNFFCFATKIVMKSPLWRPEFCMI